MTNLFRTHGKKILAVLGVILMITFILPPTTKYGSGGGESSQRVVGRAGETKVYDHDISRAKRQWDYIQHVIVKAPSAESDGKETSIAEWYYKREGWFKALYDLVSEHPEMFYLLQLEADRMGLMVTPQQADTLFVEEDWAVRLGAPTNAVVPLDQVADEGLKNSVRDAAAALFRVQQAMNRAGLAVKISRPERQQRAALDYQQVFVAYTALDARDFLKDVPPPTAEQLQKQFATFADVEPGMRTQNNLQGFGYMYPNRVALQYIGVRRQDVRDAVQATYSKYEWDVRARKEYNANPQKYQTPPATAPATAPATGPTLQPLSAAPTTQPFDKVRDRIVESLMAPLISARLHEVQSAINARVLDDWNSFHAKNPNPATLPTTRATTLAATHETPGDYASYEYLQRVASDVQKQTGVLPVIGAINRFADVKELEKLEGIGTAKINQFPFARYATELAPYAQSPANRNNSLILNYYQPSQTVRGEDGSTYVFRLTGAQAATAPASIEEVADAVKRDFEMARAYELAKKRGWELIEHSKAAGSLAAAEKDLKVIEAGPVSAISGEVPGATLPPEALPAFRAGALGLLAVAATQPSGPPLKIIELPVQNQILVVQLLSAKPRADVASNAATDVRVEFELLGEWATPVVKSWFDYNSIVARLSWKDETHAKNSRSG